MSQLPTQAVPSRGDRRHYLGETMDQSLRTDQADDLMFIEDPRVPERIRERALRFQPHAAYAAWGGSDWVLFAKDGRAMDLRGLK